MLPGTTAAWQPAPSDPSPADAVPSSGILDLDIEQLGKTPVVVPSMDIPVTSVAKEESTVGQSAAAVFVITNEMIRRSGATCIPEALRMSPGLDVARVNSSSWAITCRGFNNMFANKLLVLIDGRTVYSPSFSGTYWDMQDVVLEDVERIEVIRGPGGTLWGANAVNGVINIITKNARDTQGAYVDVGGGDIERSHETVRLGSRLGEDAHYRVYGKYFDRSAFYNENGKAGDAWTQGQFGFRTDMTLDRIGNDTLTVQGDHYLGNSAMTAGFWAPFEFLPDIRHGETHTTGQNVLFRWRHVRDEDSDWTVQGYFDNAQRTTILNSSYIRTFDLELKYHFRFNDRHQITCGGGYRNIHDRLPSTDPYTLGVIPEERTTFIANQYIQDEITLSPDLWALTLGCKVEQNSYTCFEYQPSIRLRYTPDRKHTAWGAISRAVHTPSRVDENLLATELYFRTEGNPNMISETLFAYELGWREQTTPRFSWDVALFYNDYDHLRTVRYVDLIPPFLVFQLDNGATASSYGVELASNWAVSERWRLSAQYTYLHMNVFNDMSLYGDGFSPRNQVYFRSAWNLTENLDFDLMARYVDVLEQMMVPSYITMDLRLAWRPRKHLELAIVGQNLLDTYHPEFGRTTENTYNIVSEVPRGVYGTATWRF